MKRYHVFSKVAILLLLVVSLAACSSKGESPDPVASVDPGNSSEEQVVLKIMDWSDSVKEIREEFNKRFMEKYPHIKIEYTQLTIDQFQNTILTAIKGGNAPDLFPIPSTVKLATAVNEGWFQPIDPYVEDDFKDHFVEGTFQNGITMFDNQIYSIPENPSIPSSLIFYNKKLLQEAGVDVTKQPLNYSEFREAAAKVTAAGKGKYYGIVEGGKQANRWLITVRDWASLAGAGLNGNSPISLADGKPTYNSEAVLGVYSLFQQLAEDGSFHPKTMSISAPEARALFGQGQAAFIVQGSWCIGVWNKENPELDYGVIAPPVPDTGIKGSIGIGPSGAWMGISADSKHPQEAALYLQELYLGDYYQQARVASGDSFSIVKGINEANINVPQLQEYYDIIQQYGKLIPDAAVRNPSATSVFEYYKDIQPDPGQLLAGTVAGAIKDYAQELDKYSKKVDMAWSSSIEAAQNAGNQVKAEDFIFPNWKPMENYTAENYAQLP